MPSAADKRKRKRPTDSDKAASASQTTLTKRGTIAKKGPGETEDGDASAGPSKRTRNGSKKANAGKGSEVEVDQEGEEVEDANEGDSNIPNRSERETRNSKVRGKNKQNVPDSDQDRQTKGKKRQCERPPQAESHNDEQPEQARPYKKNKKQQQQQQPDVEETGRATRASRRSGDQATNEQEQEEQEQPDDAAEPRQGKRGRPKKFQGDDDQNQEEPEQNPDRPRKRRKRSSHSSRGNPASRSPSPDPSLGPENNNSFRQITTTSKRIPARVIESKWSPLDEPAANTVTSVLAAASRSVLLRLDNPKRHAQASAALNTVCNQLRSKLHRGMPFPPTSSRRPEDDLDYDRVVALNGSLEAKLDPVLHSVEVLKREKERVERELEHEYCVLSQLTQNARTAGRQTRELVRKVHPLVPELDLARVRDPDAKRLGDVGLEDQGAKADGDEGKIKGGTFVDMGDETLDALAGQVASHMDSMKGNLGQIDGVGDAIEESRAALRLVLLDKVGVEAWGRMVLG